MTTAQCLLWVESGRYSFLERAHADIRGVAATPLVRAEALRKDRSMLDRRLQGAVLLLALLLIPSCSQANSDAAAAASVAARSEGLILAVAEGERRVRRLKETGLTGLPDPLILKVDRRNGGSQDLVMGYEELAPDQKIEPHRHLVADEIIFVHKGSGMVTLGDRRAEVTAGGTVYIPRNVRIALENTGSVPLGIVFIFSKPGFEELMRDNSVLEGEAVTELTAAERAEIRARHSWHTVRD